jgi:PAS domain S-box-containing protein
MDMALSGRTTLGLLITATTVIFLSRLTGVRAGRYVKFIITFSLVLAAVNVFVLPLNGSVAQIDRVRVAWGEVLSFPRRAPPGWWGMPIYAVILSVYAFGFYASRRLWVRDRIGGPIVALACAGGLLSFAVAILADIFRADLPYVGGLPQVFTVTLIALLQSRDYQQRGERLATGERRFRAIFDQTFQFIGLLTVDGRLLEANRTALAFAGIREEDVIGKPFWDTPWWTHSPDLQQQLRDAVAAAGRGEFVRLEATHPAADGTLHHVDFSLKPVRDESGSVVLLIPEGRDVTDRQQAEETLHQIISCSTDATGAQFLKILAQRLTEACQVKFAFIGAFNPHDPTQVRTVGVSRYGRSLDDVNYDPRDTPCEQVLGKELCYYPSGVQQLFPKDVLLVQLGIDSYMGVPLFSSSGTPLGLLVLMHDRPIPHPERAQTLLRAVAGRAGAELEREQAVVSLSESEARYRTLVEFAPEALLVLEMDQGKFVDVNENACRMFDLSREELLRRGPLDLSLPLQPDGRASAEKAPEMLGQALNGKAVRVEWMCRDAGGREIPCEISLVRLPSAERPLIRGSVIDITERKRAEELLRRKDAELRQLAESNMIGIVFWTVNEALDEANDYFLELVGYTRDDLAHGNLRWADLTVPDYQPLHQLALTDVVERGSCTPFETEYVTKDGRHVPVLIGSTRIDPQSHRGVAFVLDLSERKRLEEQVRQAQKMQAVGQLAGGVAHDFNNLLTIIISCAEALLARLPSGDALRGSANSIVEAGERAASLTRQLLAFSRQQVLQPKALNLNHVVSNTEQLLKRLIREDVILTADLDPNLGIVKADPSQLEQVLINLAVNARDAMPQGGQLTIETGNVVLDDAFCRALPDLPAGPYALLVVRDTGIGMDEATKARAFEPFFTTKGPGKGTGLGLATVHGIVKQTGGHVELFSEPSGGTIVKIYLPRIEEAPPADKSEPATRDMPCGSETILLVEDEEQVRMLGQRILRSCGYAVLEAKDGNQALEVAGDHVGPINILVSDVVMPHLGGKELADRISARRPECRVLFLSGYTADAVIRHGVVESEFDFLQKPFTPTQLARKVRDVLDRHVQSVSCTTAR